MKSLLGLQSVRMAWQAAAGMAVACTAASGANATTISFSPYSQSNLLISLAGSTSPLYSMTYQEGSTSSTQTIMKCSSPAKFGGCNTTPQQYNQTTTTDWNNTTFNSLQPNALIGLAYSTDTIPDANESFTTASKTVRAYSQTSTSNQEYGSVPTAPYPSYEAPLANEYVHLKFDVDGIDYLGLAYFDMSTDLASIEYSAIDGAAGETLPVDTSPVTYVPEPDSWMLLTAGLGLAVLAVGRGRSRAARGVAT